MPEKEFIKLLGDLGTDRLWIRLYMERDIALTFDFLRYLADHPEMMDEIPDSAELEFIGSDIITAEPAEDHSHGKKRTIISTKRVFEFLHPLQTPSTK